MYSSRGMYYEPMNVSWGMYRDFYVVCHVIFDEEKSVPDQQLCLINNDDPWIGSDDGRYLLFVPR